MLGARPLTFTDKYKYLGVTLDCEMSLTDVLADRKKIVLQKLFKVRKLRYYVDEKGALAIYKHTILPIFDYAGFMLIACAKSDRHDLQVQCTSDIVATLGHHFLATISDWPLYPT